MESPDKQMDAAPPAPPPLNDKVSEGANAQKQSLRREDSVDDMRVSIPVECSMRHLPRHHCRATHNIVRALVLQNVPSRMLDAQ